MTTRHGAKAAAVLLAGALAVAGCSSGGDDDGAADTTTSEAPAVAVRLHQVQVIASHNSYHLEAPPSLLDAVARVRPDLVETVRYSHPPLPDQLDYGVRALELDVFQDPEGGRYATPKAVASLGLDPVEAVMAEPGFKVFHMQEIDYRSTCPTFVGCLEDLRDWSEDHPGHLPITIQLEVKDGLVLDVLGLGFTQPIPIDAAAFTALEAEIRSVLDEDQLLTPAQVQGGHPTLRAAVEADGWPELDDVRGRFAFVLDDHAAKRELYRSLHPATTDRLLFVDAEPPADDAAYVVLNEPVRDAVRVRELVTAGYLVRTRADADLKEAIAGDHTRADAALASGAQVITTDYARLDPRHPGYVVELPDGGAARCNPVSAPPGCQDSQLDER